VRPLPDLSIAQLRNFLLVADLRSFKAAAERANRSQPALSLSIREMEDRIGQPLFDRSTRGTPTSFGRQCLPLARQLVEQYDRFSDEVGRLASHQAGTLRIASVVTASTQWLCRVVPAYLEALPGVRVHLIDDNTPGIEQMVLDERIDFGICSPGSADKRLRFDLLARDRFGVVCSRSHPLARRRSIRWSDLERQVLIATVVSESLMHSHPEVRTPARPAMFVAHMGTLLNLIERGVGVALLPAMSASVAEGRLAFIPLIAPASHRELGILSLKGRTLAPPADAMKRMLMKVASER
jgi:DNA-binding transcriptional LysR family regulator